MVTKEKEIKLLTELIAADGYFAEYFKKDLDQMTLNIKNDFPIEHGALFSMDGENQRQINEQLKQAHKDDIYKIVSVILQNMGSPDKLEDEATVWVGRNEVIKMKRMFGIELSERDIDYMISKLS